MLSKHISNKSNKIGADKNPQNKTWFTQYFFMHKLALRAGLTRFLQGRLGSVMTVFVIGIALTLPAALQVAVKNAEQIAPSMESSAQITLYMEQDVSLQDVASLASEIKRRKEVAATSFISPDDALKEFQQNAELGDALSQLSDNPLPAVILVTANREFIEKDAFNQLILELSALPLVKMAQADLYWLERLLGIIQLVKQTALVITIFLIIAVIMMVGNTIRLMSQSYKDEIEISKLVGATDSFVRRPFIYSGIFYGFFGGLVSIIIVIISTSYLQTYIANLAQMFDSQLTLLGLSFIDSLTLIITGTLLGFGGSWIAVSRYLHELNL